MPISRRRTIFLAVSCVLAVALTGGYLSAAPPATLWRFLGIPQTYNRIRDATANRSGNRPQAERTRPLKRIADPEHLDPETAAGKNPAINAAAKVKEQEDLAPQKIKAIKYLATIGCGCYPEVRAALLAALDDCTEEIRYEAAMAFCRASGNPCVWCNPGSCCNKEVTDKLKDMAYGQDEQGCWKEPSARVRAAAALALNACERIMPPEPVVPVERKELPVEGTRGLEPGAPTPAPEAPTPPEAHLIPKQLFRPASHPSAQQEHDVSAPGEVMVTPDGVSVEHQVTAAEVSYRRGRCGGCARVPCVCPPSVYPQGTMLGEPGEALEPTPDMGEAMPEASPTPPPSALAGTFGAAPGPASVAPYMIGDFFGGSFAPARIPDQMSPNGGYYDPDNGTYDPHYGAPTPIPQIVVADVPSPGTGGGVGRLKIAENTSPIPRDRMIFNYTYFGDVPLAPGGVDVSRYTVGFEKTFFDGLTSFEMKIPMATTLDSTILAGDPNYANGEFGNMNFTFKGLFLSRDRWNVAGGLTIAAPTADDIRVVLDDGTERVRIENEAVHFQPFLGVLWTPNERFYAQGFLQYDVASIGHPVFLDEVRIVDPNYQGSTPPLLRAGRLNDATFQFLDLGVGYWTYKAPCPGEFFSGLAWTAELHWNKSLQEADVIRTQNYVVGDFGSDVDVWDLTLGAHLLVMDRTSVTFAYATPLGGGADRQFDGEFRLMLNYHYGRSRRAPRAPMAL